MLHTCSIWLARMGRDAVSGQLHHQPRAEPPLDMLSETGTSSATNTPAHLRHTREVSPDQPSLPRDARLGNSDKWLLL